MRKPLTRNSAGCFALDEYDRKILSIVTEDPSAEAKTIAEKMFMHINTVRQRAYRMRDAGILETRKSKGKKARWKVNNDIAWR